MVNRTHWPVPRATAPVRATCDIPGSKSLTNRYFVLAALADAPSIVRSPLVSRDTELMMRALDALGATFTPHGNDMSVDPIMISDTNGAEVAIDCGLAGTVMRFVPPVALATGARAHFDGDPQARVRPMQTILDALSDLGAKVESEDGYLPFSIAASEHVGHTVTIDASQSSQFVSGLLLSAARFPLGLTVKHLGETVPSKPHIDMTVATLKQYGVEVTQPDPTTWAVKPGPVHAIDVTVEPDLSNASTFLGVPLIAGGSVTVPHWPTHTDQAGHAFVDIARAFGGTAELTPAGLTVTGTGTVKPVDLDLSQVGELTPVVAAIAAHAHGTSHLRGIGHLRGHETDRLTALATELTKAGAQVEEGPDYLTITAPVSTGCTWNSYADHRMVMAGALVGLTQDVTIEDPDTVAKTLPQFTDMFERVVNA